ncbi:MAG: glycosyltransferase family 39 protein [Candidatus Omnitrophota bacterium]|nr:glycosyltransferase family 39 protein [Candidatus Omnitrophota bacterium]MDZ4243380.1 glycosyltransferase family 39 protein [Candidatus Omnitrophota bacterium]
MRGPGWCASLKTTKGIAILVLGAMAIKLGLFWHILTTAPMSIYVHDSHGYLRDAEAIRSFLANPSVGLEHSHYRTPGYPFFLAVFHHGAGWTLHSIVFLQIVLTAVSARIVACASHAADGRPGLLSGLFLLYDLPTTIYSSLILTESLFVLGMAVFLYVFIRYLRSGQIRLLFCAGAVLAASCYIRPVAYYLGLALVPILLFAGPLPGVRRKIGGVCVFLAVCYGLLFVWQARNFSAFHDARFSSIGNATVRMHGIGAVDPSGHHNSDIGNSLRKTARNVLILLTEPGNMKYFESSGWKVFGKVFGYLFVAFWVTGLLPGIGVAFKDRYHAFVLYVILYFVAVTVAAAGTEVTPRFRVGMMPFIALLSARGWEIIITGWRSARRVSV